MDVKVIIAAHKKYQMPPDEMYLPVHVGARRGELVLRIMEEFISGMMMVRIS